VAKLINGLLGVLESDSEPPTAGESADLPRAERANLRSEKTDR